MDEYKRIQKEHKRLIVPIKIISFSICLLFLSQDIAQSLKFYFSNPFMVITKLIEANLIETPTLGICIGYQANMSKLAERHPSLYKQLSTYRRGSSMFRETLFNALPIQEHLDMAISLDDIGRCDVLLPNGSFAPCSRLSPVQISVSPFRLCFSYFERKRANLSDFVYKRAILEQPWVTIEILKSKMDRDWVDVILNGLPRARLCYHGFPGFISLSTNFYKHVKIGAQLHTVQKLKLPYENDCQDYNSNYSLPKCYSRESCIELCYATEAMAKYNRWPKNLQTFLGLDRTNLSTSYFSMNESGIERLRATCGDRFPKSDCLSYHYITRIIEEEMVKRHSRDNKYQIYIYSYFEVEKTVIYRPAYNNTQLSYDISQSVASFLGFCLLDFYKPIIYLYDLFNSQITYVEASFNLK